VTYEESLAVFKATVIDNFQRLEAQVGKDHDLERLFRQYQRYLKRPAPLAI
jgi:hypothetical protein